MNISFIKTPLAKELEFNYSLNFTPIRKTKQSVGYDLSACFAEETKELKVGEIARIGTGIKIDVHSLLLSWGKDSMFAPTSIGAFIFPRSSLCGVRLTNSVGVVDLDYQGEILLSLQNMLEETYVIERGQRLAQIVFAPVFLPQFIDVEGFKYVSERAEGGFGSTGK